MIHLLLFNFFGRNSFYGIEIVRRDKSKLPGLSKEINRFSNYTTGSY